MKKLILLLLLIIIGLFLHGGGRHPMEGLVNPGQVAVDRDNGELFIVDGTEIRVYRLADLNLKAVFGKKGEGPGEILPPVSIGLHKDAILVNSRNKVSFYDRKLNFMREHKVTSGKRFATTGKRFAGQGFKVIGQDGYETFNFFDKDFNKGKEIISRKSPIQRSGKIPVLSSPFIFRVYRDIVYYSFNDNLELGIFRKGKNIADRIRFNYENKPFTASDKAAFETYFKTNPRTRKNYEALRQRLEYPTHYPAIRTFLVDEGKIYVITHRKNNDGAIETFVLNKGGELIKKSFIWLKDMNIFSPYPFSISAGKLYQLIETDDEKWELHIIEI